MFNLIDYNKKLSVFWMGETGNTDNILTLKPLERWRWEGNFKTDIGDTGCMGGRWKEMDQDEV
jgi:hypothetical protein